MGESNRYEKGVGVGSVNSQSLHIIKVGSDVK